MLAPDGLDFGDFLTKFLIWKSGDNFNISSRDLLEFFNTSFEPIDDGFFSNFLVYLLLELLALNKLLQL